MANLVKWLKDRTQDVGEIASRTYDAVNPLDNGRTFTQRTPTTNQNAVQQAGQAIQRTPVGQAAGQVGRVLQRAPQAYQALKSLPAVQPLKNPVTRFVDNNFIEPSVKTESNVGKLLQARNPYTGSGRQQAGQALQDAINLGGSVPIGKGVQLASKATALRPLIRRGVTQGAKVGAGFGAAQGVSTSLQNEQNLPQSIRTIATSTALGAGIGAAGGAAAPLVGAAARNAAPAARKGVQLAKQADQRAFTPRVNLDEQAALRDFSDTLVGANRAQGSELSSTIARARQVGSKYGIDLANGSVEERLARANSILDQVGQKGRAVAQGGYIKIPGNEQIQENLYHGTDADVQGGLRIRPAGQPAAHGNGEALGRGIYFTPDKTAAAKFGKNVHEAKLRDDARLVEVGSREYFDAIRGKGTKDVRQVFLDAGYDGLKNTTKNGGTGEVVVFNEDALDNGRPRSNLPARIAENSPTTRKELPTINSNNGGVSVPLPSSVTPFDSRKKTRYASKTVPESEFVSEQIRKDVKAGAPLYDVETERARYTSSLSRLKAEGDDTFEANVKARLDVPNGKISSQDVADTQTIAAMLDAKGDDNSLQRATELYEKLSTHLTAAGQTVQAAAILSRRTPDGLRYWATKQLTQAGIKPTPEFQQRLTKLISATKGATDKDKAIFDVTKLVNDNIPSSTGDRIINLWRAGLLTSPTTTGGNLLGNAGETLVRKGFVNPVATAADAAMSLFTGKRTQTLASAGSASSGFREGTKTLPGYIKTGYDPRNLGIKYEQPRDLNYGNGKLGKALGGYVNGVYRLMGVADAPFSTAAEKEALSSIANAEALNKGLRGSDKQKFVQDFISNPPEAAVNRAAKEADYATFKNPTGLGTLIAGGKQALEKRGYQGTKAAVDFVVPFTQVPSAIATRLIERTPIGIAKEIAQQIKAVKSGEMFDQRAMAQAIGNGSFGTVAIGAGMSLAKSGQLTFGYPADSKERALWEAEGKQPYSVRVGNRWYSLNYLQPFGMLLAIGGQAHKDIADGKSSTEVTTKALATAGQAIQEQSFLKGINGVLSAISDPERSAQKWMESTTSSIVPNFVRAGARAADEVQRKPETIIEGVKSGIPGLRGQTPVKDDLFGQPLPAKDNFANQYLNPLKPSIDRSNDPVLAEARRLFDAGLGVTPSEVKKDSLGEGLELDKEQLRQLQASVGKGVKQAWDKLTQDEQYKSLSDEDKQKALSEVSKDILSVEKRKFATDQGLLTGDEKNLTTNQKKIASGELRTTNYTTTNSTGLSNNIPQSFDKGLTETLQKYDKMDGDERKQAFKDSPSAEYELEYAKYQKDMANKSLSKKDQISRQNSVAKLAAGKDTPKEVRELYSLGKDDIEKFIDTDPEGKRYATQLLAYDDALVKAKINDKHKFRDKLGNVKYGTGKAAGKGKKGKAVSGAAIAKSIANPSIGRARQSSIRARIPGAPKFALPKVSKPQTRVASTAFTKLTTTRKKMA